MKAIIAVSAIALGAALAAASGPAARADEPVGYATGASLLAKYQCQSCHALDEGGRGPSLHAIADKYAGDPHAREDLAGSVRNGSVGAWGPTPMAGYDVPDSDLRPLVDWILSLQH
jgi:cytochrome c